MVDARVLEKKLVVVTSSGKVWELKLDDSTVTLYANEADYNAGTAVGSMGLIEFKEVYGFLKAWPT